MLAGRLRHRVTVQQVTLAQNTYGEPVETWADLGTVWAHVAPATGNERFVAAGDQTLATLTHAVQIRYLDGLSPVNHRLVWDEKVLDIHAVQDVTGKEAEMRVLCREEVVAGVITAFDVGNYSLDFSQAANSMYLAGV